MTRHFEPISPASAEPLSLLHRACFPEDPWDAGAVLEIAGMTGFFGLIASEDDQPAGFAMALALGDECELLSLGVLPYRRRIGIGAALLHRICSGARRYSAQRLVLEVAVDNFAARSLYTKWGFTPVGCRQNYYNQAGHLVDALVLHRTLSALPVPT